MTAPESVRDRLERRARELRADADMRREQGLGPVAIDSEVQTARALEEVVAALDGASAWYRGNPGGEDARRTLDKLAGDDFEGEDVSQGGSA